MDLNEVKRKVAELEAKGDIPKAIAEMEKAIESFPNDGTILNKLGDLYLKVNKSKEALDYYEKGVVAYKEETFYTNAVALCKKILRLDKERTEIYRYLGDLLKELDTKGEAATYYLEYADRKLKRNELETALEIYSKIKELTPNNPKIISRIAEIHKLLKHDREAETLYKEAAEIYKEQGKLKEAHEIEKTAEPAVAKVEIKPKPKIEMPKDKITLETLVSPEVARLLEDLPKTEEKEKAEEKVGEVEAVVEKIESKVEPKEKIVEEPVSAKIGEEVKSGSEETDVVENIQGVDGILELANLYYGLGSMDEAFECYRMASDEAFNIQDWDKSLAIYQKIVELRPFDLRSRQRIIEIARRTKNKKLEVEGMLELADSLFRREAQSEAVTLYKKILSIEPDNPIAKEKLAAYEGESKEEYIDLGAMLKAEIEEGEAAASSIQNIRELLSEFRKEVFESIGEGDYHSHYDLGVAYKGMGLYNEAIEEFHIATKDRSLALKAFEMIGACLIEKEKMDDAITILEAGMRIPNHPPIEYFGLNYLLAQAYENKGDINKALQLYAKAYKLDPSIKEVRIRIEELKKNLTDKRSEPKEGKEPKVAESKKSRITYL